MAGPWSGHGRLQTTKLAGSARRFRPGLCVRQVMVQPSPCAQVRCGECNGPDDAAWPARPLWCCCRRWRRGQVHCLYCVEAAQDFADCPRRCDYPRPIQLWISMQGHIPAVPMRARADLAPGPGASDGTARPRCLKVCAAPNRPAARECKKPRIGRSGDCGAMGSD
jgi:hypothetical protein